MEPERMGATKVVPLDSLSFDAKNARRHGKANLKAIKASLIEFGQVMPLVVEKGTGRVIGGNGTLRAMRSLKWTEAAVVEVDEHDARATALGIALNRTGELAEWDDARLAEALKEQAFDFDMEAMGWADADLRKLLGKKLDIPDEDDGDDAAKAGADGLRYRIVIDCEGEEHQAELVARLEQEGLKVQPLIS